MIPNTISKVQIFNQVTKISTICPHAIHWKTIGMFQKFDRFCGFFVERRFVFPARSF
jgi:hypothetical protein